MFRAILATLIVAIGGAFLHADPGPQLPLFRRSAAPTRTTPTAPPAKPSPVAAPPAAQGLTAEATAGDEVDSAEVIRRGDHVSRAGRGPMDGADQLIGDVTAPPPDDSHKWFFSVIVDESAESKAFLYDLKHSPHLRAWINVDDHKQSWSHCTVYRIGDQAQDWRWSKLKITRFPVLVLQPPAKLLSETDAASWQWGDPKTIVWQWDGYDATSPNRAQLRSDAIRKAMTLYCSRAHARRYAGPRSATAPPATPGARRTSPGPKQESIGGPPPFDMRPIPSYPSSNPFPVFPADPTLPSGPVSVPTGGGLSLMLAGASMLGGATGITNILLVLLIGVQVFRAWRQASGKPLLLDDESFGRLTEVLRTMAGRKSPTTPTT